MPLRLELQAIVALPLPSMVHARQRDGGVGDRKRRQHRGSGAPGCWRRRSRKPGEYCDVISATVLATSVTWRSALIASVTWMLPKYITSISGSRIANSTTDEPRRSATKRRDREARWTGRSSCRRRIGFVAEGDGRDQRVGVVGRVDEPDGQTGRDDRPLVDQPHDDDVAGIAGRVAEPCRVQRAVGVGRARQADVAEKLEKLSTST